MAKRNKKKQQGPRVLLFDIETAPIIAYLWGLWKNDHVGLNQVLAGSYVIGWAAKWLDSPESEVMVMSQRNARNMEDDSRILRPLWRLLNKADIVITHNGKSFDQKVLNARFVTHGLQPTSSFKHIDTMLLAQKHFRFPSNKLEYLTGQLCTRYKKLKHSKYPGFELWRECLDGNQDAWEEMEKYNKHDVLSLEELFRKLVPWDDQINFSLYFDDVGHVCKCGSRDFKKQGWHYTNVGKYQRYRCKKCGAETRDRDNRFSTKKKQSLRIGTPR